MAGNTHSPILYTYLKKYQADPTSRVFAPLAEAYRKAGLLEEAIDIAREGLKIHPGFTGGRVALARALFDQKKYSEVISELGQVVQDAPDNLVAQRLLAESYLIEGRVAEALSAYKMLLFFSPADAETAKIVQELEADAYERGAIVLRTDPKPPRPLQPPRYPASPLTDQDRQTWIRKVELLQSMLQRVERYKARQV